MIGIIMSSAAIAESHGIKFFESAAACIEDFEARWVGWALSLIQSFGTFFLEVLRRIYLHFQENDPQFDLLALEDDYSKKRLVVCLHGLNGSHYNFQKIVGEMKKRDLSDTDIFIPSILDGGNATLDEMVRPILSQILRWEKTSGEKELVLVGISNGSRIARAIETELAKTPTNIRKIKFVSIVGACRGSALMNLVNKLHLSWLFSRNIAEEMPADSARTLRLNREWEAVQNQGPQREYTLLASPHDWMVNNYDSTLMDVTLKRGKYALVRGHGHWSIVDAVRGVVAQAITAT